MSKNETIARTMGAFLLGLVFLLLFTVQVKGGAIRFTPSHSDQTVRALQQDDQRQALWQVEENASRDGIMSDWQTALAAAVVLCVLLAFFNVPDEEKPCGVTPSLSSRNLCCIVPKGP